MGNTLTRGQKIIISKEDDAVLTRLALELTYKNQDLEDWDIDLFAFMIDESNTIRKKNIVFYNQPTDDHSSFYFTENYQDALSKSLDINFKKVPGAIHKIPIGISIYKHQETIKDKLQIYVDCIQNQMHSSIFQIEEVINIKEHNSFFLGEFYKYKDSWKFGAIFFKSHEPILSAIKNFYNVKIV